MSQEDSACVAGEQPEQTKAPCKQAIPAHLARSGAPAPPGPAPSAPAALT